MSESVEDMIARLELMASGDSQWDLSANDCAAIAWAVKHAKSLNRTHHCGGRLSPPLDGWQVCPKCGLSVICE